jgi:hypothetical protein
MKHIEPFCKKYLSESFSQLPERMFPAELAELSFYAGAACMFAILMEKIESGPSNKDGGKFLFEVEQELLRYMDKSVQIEVQTK